MHCNKKIFLLLILFYGYLSYAQSDVQDSLRGEFIYQLKAKFDTRTDNRYKELFLLQITDRRAFFANTISLKGDSVISTSGITTHNPDGSITLGYKENVVIPKTNMSFTIIQSNEGVQFFDNVGTSLLTYKESVIKNWRLVNETKVINTLNCKKAEVTFKGRNWIAWYSPEIPFPYGPLKFSGLPGLIVKITDDKGDFDFELVRSLPNSQLKNRFITFKKSRYSEAIETTQLKLKEALKNTNTNAASVLASYGTTIVKGQNMLRQSEKEKVENQKFSNPLELTP